MVVAQLPNTGLKDSRTSDRLRDYPELVSSIGRFADALWKIPAVTQVIATLERGEVYVVTLAKRTDDASYAGIYAQEHQLEQENSGVFWNFRVSSVNGNQETEDIPESALVIDRPAAYKR